MSPEDRNRLTFHTTPSGNIMLERDISLPTPSGLHEVIIPKGYVSNGFSYPRILQPLTGPPIRSKWLVCAVGHDYLCERSGNLWERAIADALFGYWLWYFRAGFVRASAHFWAVLIWGRLAFWKWKRIKRYRR